MFDLETGEWTWQQERAYFDPWWDVGDRIKGNCPVGARTMPLSLSEAHSRRDRSARQMVEAAIEAGTLPEPMQRLVHTFDIRPCIEKAAQAESPDILHSMMRDRRFHKTFCDILLDSLRNPSPVAPVGVAVFEQIKVTFKEHADDLKEHLVREYIDEYLV